MLKSNRRKFIATATTLAASTAVNASSIIKKEEKLIAHQVYFWLKNPGSAEDKAELIRGIKTLEKIETVRKISIGVVAATEKRPVIDDSWSVSEHVLFDNLEGQKVYQVHALHVAFAKDYGHLWSKVIVYDSLLV
jgi:hypothetical protein